MVIANLRGAFSSFKALKGLRESVLGTLCQLQNAWLFLYCSRPPLRSLAPAQDPASYFFLKIVKPTNSLSPDRDPTV